MKIAVEGKKRDNRPVSGGEPEKMHIFTGKLDRVQMKQVLLSQGLEDNNCGHED